MVAIDGDSFHGSFMRRFVQLATFILFVWWAAVIKSVSAILRFLFGPDYKQAIYGKNIKKAKFLLDDSIPVTNHGSYGTVPKKVFEVQQQLKEEMERCPDGWFRSRARHLWYESLETVARFVGADANNLVFVPNATAGINSVMQSLDISEGDGVLILNQTYGAVQIIAQEICQSRKAKLLVLNIAFPTKDMPGSVRYYATEVVEHFEIVLQENPCIKVAIVDAITSNSAVKLPFKKITDVCHRYGVTVLLDGAHAPGQIPLDLERIQADFFVGNLHKWLFAPRGCAILYVDPKFHDVIMPQVISWNHDKSLQDRFWQQGTIDHTPYIASAAAIKFYLDCGGMGAIVKYNSQLASWASKTLAAEWKTEVLPVPESMRAPCMAVVRLPRELTAAYGATQQGGDQMSLDIFDKYRVVCTIVSIQASLWCRVAAQVYNVKEDYLALGEAILKLKTECQNGFRPHVEKAVESNRWSWGGPERH